MRLSIAVSRYCIPKKTMAAQTSAAVIHLRGCKAPITHRPIIAVTDVIRATMALTGAMYAGSQTEPGSIIAVRTNRAHKVSGVQMRGNKTGNEGDCLRASQAVTVNPTIPNSNRIRDNHLYE